MRLAALVAVLAALVAAGSATASTPTDPRQCDADSARLCARGAAVLALRRAMSERFYNSQGPGRSLRWAASVNCTGFVGFLRWRCSFRNGGETGWALVLLGQAPNWKPTVVVKSMVCLVKPERRGCP